MNAFSYARPDSIAEAVELLKTNPGSHAMGGGVDLIHEAKRGIRSPSLVVDIRNIEGLSGITMIDGALSVGPLVTLHALERSEVVAAAAPLVSAAVHEIATPQLREMATVAGNILQRPQCWYYRDPDSHCLRKGGQFCHAVAGDNRYHAILGGGPCHIVCPSDLAPALLALGASVEITGQSGTRTIPIAELFVGPGVDPHNEHILTQGELITRITVPARPGGAEAAFLKARERRAWDFSLASVAVELALSEDGVVESGSMALGGVAPNAWDASEALSAVIGVRPDVTTIAAVAEAALESARPLRQNAYKIDLARALIRQALDDIAGRL